MNYKMGECNGCGKELYLVNAKYKLCKVCNSKRLNEGKEQKTYSLQRQPLQQKAKEKHLCVGCDQEHYLVNMKHRLCGTCNTKRLNEGKAPKQYEIKAAPLKQYVKEKKTCADCGQEHYLVNAKHQLCGACNTKRLNEGKTPKQYEIKQTPLKEYVQEKKTCVGCGQEQYLVNAKHGLCNPCNTKRLNEGKDPKVYELKKTAINPISKKQQAKNKELYAVYEQLKTPNMCCSGCGTKERLSPSHVIPRSRRADLITDPRNITWHCMSMGEIVGCHEIWESHDRPKLKDYEKNMAYIKEVDEEYYNILRFKDKFQ